MAPHELQNNCALWEKLIERSSDFIKETIGGRNFRFDTSDCTVMFKRLLSVYGNEISKMETKLRQKKTTKRRSLYQY
jgi:hypothetical protein